MRPVKRDLLLFILAISAGSADGWSYFGLGHAFVANMTGNTVLLGISVFDKRGDLLHPLISLGCYAVGVALASFFTRKVRPGVGWAKAISWTLLLEAVFLAGAEAGWVAVHRGKYPARDLTLLLGCVALAIGLQSGAMLQLKVPGVVTTYITGTWTNLMNGVVRFEAGSKRRGHRKEVQIEERLGMQAGVLVVYFLSAVLTGWLFRYYAEAVGAVPAAAVLTVAIYGAFRSEKDGAPKLGQADSPQAEAD